MSRRQQQVLSVTAGSTRLMTILLVAALLLPAAILAAPPSLAAAGSLGNYNIISGSITTSGISSGAVMATQFHVVHSSSVNGVGIFAGVPYGCALGLIAESLNCMLYPNLIVMANLYGRVATYDFYNNIDTVDGLVNDKVFIFHGTEDSVVNPGSGDNVETFYNNYNSLVYKKNDIAAQHCMPTDNYGGACDQLNSDSYINNCGYNGAFEMSNYLYGGGLIRPSGNEAVLSNLLEFDQAEFFQISDPATSSMDDIGYVYVPTRCANGVACKLHVAFHGCQQGRVAIGNVYAVHAGYLEVAELNDIVILFPQAISKAISNPQGCWDWWGYNNNLYDTNNGNQIIAVKRMVDKMTGFSI
ncbi:uncharacterized protein LOC124349832 [Daphnia pulicaria]|uniref:uncharacterized protein LOC124349832 n=1 Tax=Daphnia pulicaria TaxID=35523 RepID=UPI001EECB1FE|nr:uncharacterized protein LOC124349832 [Daphnia pulicaria]